MEKVPFAELPDEEVEERYGRRSFQMWKAYWQGILFVAAGQRVFKVQRMWTRHGWRSSRNVGRPRSPSSASPLPRKDPRVRWSRRGVRSG